MDTSRVIARCLAAIVLAAIGCESSVDPTGSYDLVTVDGQTLPAIIDHDGVEIEVVSGWFEIRADGTCTCATSFEPPGHGEPIERVVDATYTLTDDTLMMQWQGAGQTVGTVAGERFTMMNEGIAFAYRRR